MIVKKIIPQLGLHYYRHHFTKGEAVELPSPVEKIGKTPTVSIVPVGKFRTWNTSREVPVDIEGSKGRIKGGLMLPGKYTLEALEDSVYICLSRLPEKFIQGFPMFDIESRSLSAGETLTVDPAKGYRAIICLWGNFTDGTQAYPPEESCALSTNPLTITATEDTEVALYRIRGVG